MKAMTAAWVYSKRNRLGRRFIATPPAAAPGPPGARGAGAGGKYGTNRRPMPPSCAGACPGHGNGRAAPRGRSFHLEEGQEGLLGEVHPAHLLHPLLPFLLLLQELALARDVPAVALGQHVLAQGGHVLARHDLSSDGGLDRHLEEL